MRVVFYVDCTDPPIAKGVVHAAIITKLGSYSDSLRSLYRYFSVTLPISDILLELPVYEASGTGQTALWWTEQYMINAVLAVSLLVTLHGDPLGSPLPVTAWSACRQKKRQP